MLLLVQAEREALLNGCEHPQDEACIAWTYNGQAIIIRKKQTLIQKLFPIAQFKAKLFSSFTRKLYRWGFRRLRKGATDVTEETIFFHSLFQRDNKKLIANMKSTTARGVKGHNMKASSRTTDQRKSSNVASPLEPVSGGLLYLPPTNDFAAPSLPRLDLTLPQACHSVSTDSLSSLAEREWLISTLTAVEMLSRPAVSHYNRLITDLRLQQRTLLESRFQPQVQVHLNVPVAQRKTALMQILQRGFEDTSPDRDTLRRLLRLAAAGGNSIL